MADDRRAIGRGHGRYDIEFDIVWEGVMWMKDRGNPTARVELAAMAS